MTSKFEREILLPAFEYTQEAAKKEAEVGVNYRLGFDRSDGDGMFCAFLVDWELLGGRVDDRICTLIHALLRWYDGGCPRFRLSHGLTTELALTDPHGVPMEQVRHPFPTYLIELPQSGSPITWDPTHAGDREPAYIFVHNELASTVPIGAPPDTSTRSVLAHLAQRRSQALRPMLSTCVLSSLKMPNTFIGNNHFVDTEFVNTRDLREDSAPDPAAVAGSEDKGALTMAWRLAFNLPLYLRHRPSSSGSCGQTVNHDHGLRSTLYEVGAEVPLNRELRDAARASCRARDAQKWDLAKRFIVRGHWKMQPFGTGRAERKMIFVEPYWKGPATAPLVARVHTDRKTR